MRTVLNAILICSLILSFWLILPKDKLKGSPGITSNGVKASGEDGLVSYKTLWEEIKANLR